MKALYYEQFKGPIGLVDLPDPEPAPDGVVVAVRANGMCRSDWHGWKGHDADIRLPHVPGHELAGDIVAVGSDVKAWSVGDRVTIPFVSGCGRCATCRGGDPQVCPDQFQPGFTAWGSCAQWVALRYADANLVALPQEVSYVTAASLGCRFATSFRAVEAQARLRAGEWMAVYGCGGVGLSAVMIGRALGAPVVAVDVRREALEMARELGAEVAVDSSRSADVIAEVRAHTEGGPHVTVDALGSAEICFTAVSSLRRRGRHVQVGLLVEDERHTALPMDRVVAWELEIFGSHGMQAAAYDQMLAMVASGALQPERLVERTVSLAQAADVITAMDDYAGRGITVVDRF